MEDGEWDMADELRTGRMGPEKVYFCETNPNGFSAVMGRSP
jgi:hypothetical protein